MSKGAAGANEPRPRVSSLWWAASLDSLFRLWLSRALSGGRDDVDEDDARCARARARGAPGAGYAARSRTRPDRRVGIGQGLQPGAQFQERHYLLAAVAPGNAAARVARFVRSRRSGRGRRSRQPGALD